MKSLKRRKQRFLAYNSLIVLGRTPLLVAVLCVATAISAYAEGHVLNITFGYRERIAPPPDAVAEISLLDISRADTAATRLSTQRFKLTGVPMTVSLHYDPVLIEDGRTYSVSAIILSGDKPIFRTTETHNVLSNGAGRAVELTLTRVSEDETLSGNFANITNVTWEITEVLGQALDVENPPTLTLNNSGQFGLYSGCNRFSGMLEPAAEEDPEGTLVFPQNFAGTLMLCPEDREALQRVVLDALGQVAKYERTGEKLALLDAEGTVVLRLGAEAE